MVARSWRFGLYAIFFNQGYLKAGWGLVRDTNSPYEWRLFLGPIAITKLRPNWDTPIVLPRQARRALARGKAISIGGYAHRARKLVIVAMGILTATVASAQEIVVRHKPGRTWNECRMPGTRTFTYFCDDAGVARPLSSAEQYGAALAGLWAQAQVDAPIVEDPARVQQRQHDELLREIDRAYPRPWSNWLGVRGYYRHDGTYVRPHARRHR